MKRRAQARNERDPMAPLAARRRPSPTGSAPLRPSVLSTQQKPPDLAALCLDPFLLLLLSLHLLLALLLVLLLLYHHHLLLLLLHHHHHHHHHHNLLLLLLCLPLPFVEYVSVRVCKLHTQAAEHHRQPQQSIKMPLAPAGGDAGPNERR